MNKPADNKMELNDRYRRVIENIDHLPSLPSIVAKLLKVVNSPDTSAEDAAELIEKDPALTSKMIRLANSAFYGIPRSISSVSSAVVILGFNTIRSLVLSASVMKMFSMSHHVFDKDNFWKHSIISAMAAKTIVRHFMSIKMMDPESAFCAGILHDIGKLIFSEFVNQDYREACDRAKSRKIPLVDAETEVMGINHAEIGKILADKWALPLDLEYCLVYHHDPASADQILDLVATVHLADQLAHANGANLWEDEKTKPEWNECRAILKINDADFARINESLTESAEKSSEFLNIIA
jgi:putative nucleotidyltransferase with HDIG domain